MARKVSKAKGDRAALPTTVKLTVRVSLELAQRLGVEASMRRVSQSAIVEEVMGLYLQRWRLPSTVGDPVESSGRRDDAA